MPFERFGDGPPWWSLATMGISTLFWLALLGGLIWAAARYLGRRQPEPVPIANAEPSAVELLRRRYVMGEIDIETYDTMLHHLMVTERSGPPRYEEGPRQGTVI